MTHDAFVFSVGRLRGLALRLEDGGKLDADEITFVKTLAGDLLIHEQEWIDALKKQEDEAGLAAIHAVAWGPST